MKGRAVEESMIYVFFIATKVTIKLRYLMVRYADATRARDGIVGKRKEGYKPLWAVQGRKRNLESIMEE